MANPTTPKQKLIADVLAALDANAEDKTNWPYDASDDDAFSLLRVVYHIERATIDVIRAVLEADDHPDRNNFLTLTNALAYGAALPSYTGKPGSVFVAHDGATYRIAEPDSMWIIDFSHTRGIVVDKPYFHISADNDIYFTGNSSARAKVRLGTAVTMADVANDAFYTNFPADLLGYVTIRALMLLFPAGGDYLEYANFYKGEWRDALAMLAKYEAAPQARPYMRSNR